MSPARTRALAALFTVTGGILVTIIGILAHLIGVV